ncbi:MAG: hypothetical protein KJI71_01525 [Patescibacteria group bacterium]|nr:hypothetical protein [Patescibacteria group bacterium]
MSREIPSYWKAAIKEGVLTEKDYWEKVEPCHILIQRAKNRQIKRILNDFVFDGECYKMSIKNHEKWEIKLNE